MRQRVQFELVCHVALSIGATCSGFPR
jgi:hypothetical protein